MELYSLFNLVLTILAFSGFSSYTSFLYGVIIGSAVWIALFVLQGVGIYTMAKNRKIAKRWLAFVPFANVFYIGKLTGPCDVFGQKMKRAGLYTMLAQIFTTAFVFLSVAARIYLYATCGLPQVDQYGSEQWTGLIGFALVCSKFLTLSTYLLSIFQLVYEILMFILLLGLYKKYVPKNYFILGMVTLFFPISRYIILFAIRNRECIDYEAYMRARREAYMRSRQQYNGYNGYGGYNGHNGYGGYNNYGNYNHPYPNGQNPYNTPQKPEEPFAEFGAKPQENQTGNQAQNQGNFGSNNESPFEDF